MRRDKKEVRSGQEAGFSAEPTRIDMQSSTRSSDETARQTSTGRRIVGVLASGLGRRSSSHYSPTDSPNSPSLLANRQFAFPMLAALAVAALGLSLLFLYNSTSAQSSAQQSVEYAEDRDDAVLTLTADDPEGVTPIVWSLLTDAGGVQDLGIFTDGTVGAADNIDDNADDVMPADVADWGDFDISEDGVLTFKKGEPDFETPNGGQLEAAESTPANGSNTYHVVVQASDGGTMEALNWFKVTVTVTDVEEAGKLAEWTVDADGDDSSYCSKP